MNRPLIIFVSLVITVYSSRADASVYSFDPIIYPGAVQTEASGINDNGQIVGTYTDATPFHALHGFLLDNGSYSSIDVPGSTYTTTFGINNAGKVVGRYSVGAVSHGYLFDGVSYTAIDVPGATFTAASGINNADWIVGYYQTVIGGQTHTRGFLFDGFTFSTISFPGSNHAEAHGINDAGQIVGTYEDGSTAHGFLFDAGLFTPIDFPGSPLTNVFAINDLGSIAGAYDNASGTLRHSFVGTLGEFMPLIPPPTYSNAIGINDAGQVVGWMLGDTLRSFLATPSSVPEPIPELGGLATWCGICLASFFWWRTHSRSIP